MGLIKFYADKEEIFGIGMKTESIRTISAINAILNWFQIENFNSNP